MEITVNVAKTIEEIETEKKEYAEEYKETCALFMKKLKDYSTYIQKKAGEEQLVSLQHPPHAPTDKMDGFDRSIKMLKAHQSQTLIMDDNEYSDLMNEVHAMKMFNNSTSETLMSLSY